MMHRTLLSACMLLAALLAVGCATRPGLDPTFRAQAPLAGGPEYVIGAGDLITVAVQGQPALTVQKIPVRPDGRISVPLAPDVPAAGRTSSEVAREIADRLRGYVARPTVSVIVERFGGPIDRQVRVLGEVVAPQSFPYREHMTLVDVMIATRGLTRYAAGNSAVIVRHGPGGAQQDIPVRLSDLWRDGDIGQNRQLEPGDTLLVPQTWF